MGSVLVNVLLVQRGHIMAHHTATGKWQLYTYSLMCACTHMLYMSDAAYFNVCLLFGTTMWHRTCVHTTLLQLYKHAISHELYGVQL